MQQNVLCVTGKSKTKRSKLAPFRVRGSCVRILLRPRQFCNKVRRIDPSGLLPQLQTEASYNGLSGADRIPGVVCDSVRHFPSVSNWIKLIKHGVSQREHNSTARVPILSGRQPSLVRFATRVLGGGCKRGKKRAASGNKSVCRRRGCSHSRDLRVPKRARALALCGKKK